MAVLSLCSLVTEVTGGGRDIDARPRISQAQVRFLRFFLDGPPDYAVWLQGRKHLCAVGEPFAYCEDATHLLVYRRATGEGDIYPGAAVNRTVIGVEDLKPLAGCWATPLRELSPTGRDLAKAPPPKRQCIGAFRQTEHERRLLHELAAHMGSTPATIVSEVMAAVLAKYEASCRTGEGVAA